MSSTMGTTPHPDDPRPVREQFMRAFPLVACSPSAVAIGVLQANNNHDWKSACWHRPLDRWWEGELPILPLPIEERWPTFMPGEMSHAPRPRPVSKWNARPAPPSPEDIARLHAESRARAAARHTDPWEREG